MASHLLIADWISSHVRPDAGADRPGLPGRPARARRRPLVAARQRPGRRLRRAHARAPGADGAGRRGRARRPAARAAAVAAALVALAYLGAAYLAQEAFKEPIEALFVLGFALLLPAVRDWRVGDPAGRDRRRGRSTRTASRAWPGSSATAVGVLDAVRGSSRREAGSRARASHSSLAARAAAAAGVLLLLVAPELPAPHRLHRLPRLPPGRRSAAGSATCATSSRRSRRSGSGRRASSASRRATLAPARSSTPARLFALVALCLALPRWIRRHGPRRPRGARGRDRRSTSAPSLFGTVYTSAKALAIAAPLVMLISLGGLLVRRRPPARSRSPRRSRSRRRPRASSSCARRPSGPTDHADELARSGPWSRASACSSSAATTSSLRAARARARSSPCATSTTTYYVKPRLRPRRRLPEVRLRLGDAESSTASRT